MEKNLSEWCTLIFLLGCLEASSTICPEVCQCRILEDSVACQGQGLSKLPEGIDHEVSILDLSHNNFNEIPFDLSNFKNLSKLSFSHNKISTLGKNAMKGIYNLRELDVSYNTFKEWKDIHPYVFATSNLVHLNLSGNTLGNFPDIGVDHFTSDTLETLIISNCSIRDLYGDIVDGLASLKTLDLSNNKIVAINAQIKAQKLQKLDLSNCSLERINEDAFALMPSLKTLILSNNYGLAAFDSNSASLEYLDASNCALTRIPQRPLNNVTVAIFKGNGIRHLPDDGLGNFRSLKSLDVSDNSISSIGTEAFRGLDWIQFIILRRNPISKMHPDTFNTNFRLKRLDLSNTYLTSVPDLDTEPLKYLDLSNCEINFISRTSLKRMVMLKTLDLSKNLLSVIPDNIESESLESLNLGLCRIAAVNKYTFAKMPRLTNLFMVGNRITTPFNTTYFYGVQNVWLNDNLWRCECNSTNFKFFNEHLKNLAKDYYLLKCYSPEEMRGKSWERACGDVWYADKLKTDRTLPICIGIVVAMLIMLCVVFVIKRIYHLKEEARREADELRRQEERERIMQTRRNMLVREAEHRETENRNAPDPRELQRPPSYDEAILLPRIDGSTGNLTGSRRDLSRSKDSLHSQGDGERKKRKKRKSKSLSNDTDSEAMSVSTVEGGHQGGHQGHAMENGKENGKGRRKSRGMVYTSESDQQSTSDQPSSPTEQMPRFRLYMESNI